MLAVLLNYSRGLSGERPRLLSGGVVHVKDDAIGWTQTWPKHSCLSVFAWESRHRSDIITIRKGVVVCVHRYDNAHGRVAFVIAINIDRGTFGLRVNFHGPHLRLAGRCSGGFGLGFRLGGATAKS